MTDKISRIDRFIVSAEQLMRDNKFESDYVNLYTYLVGYSINPVITEHSAYLHEIEMLQNYFAQAEHNSSANIFINKDYDWTYVQAFYTERRPSYRELIKLYIPVSYADIARVTQAIFDHLLVGEKTFFLKIAHRDRRDNICIWVMRPDMESTLSFLQSLMTAILPAPLFCPEYKGIGVTRELSVSFNQIIADSLFKYLHAHMALSFDGYIRFIETKYEFSPFFEFDKTIVLRSLKCIANDQCPVTSNELNIVDFDITNKNLYEI